MDERSWVSKCRTVEVAGQVYREKQRKKCEEMMKMDLRKEINKNLTRNRLV